MAKKKYYAVKHGKVKGIYFTWDDCKEMTKGVKNASFKSFENILDALEFIEGENKQNKNIDQIQAVPSKMADENTDQISGTAPERTDKEVEKISGVVSERTDKEVEQISGIALKTTYKRDEQIRENEINKLYDKKLIAYVDGSYNHASKSYGSGGVIILDDEVIEEFSIGGNDPEYASMRNVAGEIEGAIYVMKYCIENGYKNINIHYDYNGIEKWCTGEWKTNKVKTKAFKSFFDGIKTSLNVEFTKVQAHSGDYYNDIADSLAKKAVLKK